MNGAAYRILVLIAAGAAAAGAHAGPWNGQIEFGAIVTSGNSETTTYRGKGRLGYASEAWRHSATASGNQTADDGVTSSEQYQLVLRSERDIAGDANFLFFNADFQKDLFGGVRERSSQTAGYGRRVIQSDTQHLDLELGAGARQQRLQEVGAERTDEAVARAALKYRLTISETSRFEQDLRSEAGEDSVYSESISTLKMSLVGRIFVNLGFTAKHNSTVPEGRKHTDTVSSVTLSYEFGG